MGHHQKSLFMLPLQRPSKYLLGRSSSCCKPPPAFSVSTALSDCPHVSEIPVLVHMWSQMKAVRVQYMCNFAYYEAICNNKIVHILNFIDRGFILYPTMLTDLLEGFYEGTAQFME